MSDRGEFIEREGEGELRREELLQQSLPMPPQPAAPQQPVELPTPIPPLPAAAPGSVTVSLSTAGMIVKPGGTYYLYLPVRPLTGEVDYETLKHLATWHSYYGLALVVVAIFIVLTGLVPAVAAALFRQPVALDPIVGWTLVGVGALTILQALVVCGAPGTFSMLVLGVVTAAMGSAWAVSHSLQDTSKAIGFQTVVTIWLAAKGLVMMFVFRPLAVFTTSPALLVSAFASFAFAALTWSHASDKGLVAVYVAADLAVTGVAFLLISLMASAGARMREAHQVLPGGEQHYDPLASG